MSYQRLFHWRAINTEGQLQTGALLATEKNTVYEHMFRHGLQPLGVKGGKRLSIGYWRGEHLLTVTRQLATLLQAGLQRTKTGFDTIMQSVVVQSAYANLVSGDRTLLGGAVKERPKQRTQLSVWDPTIRNDMERSIVTLLDRGEFGPRFCAVMQAIALKHAHQKLEEHFADKSCAPHYTKSFGLYLARTTDPRQVFRDMELQLESGFTAPTAVTAAIETNVAR